MKYPEIPVIETEVTILTINYSETASNSLDDLTGTTWLLNESISASAGEAKFLLDFTSNSDSFSLIGLGYTHQDEVDANCLRYYRLDLGSEETVYADGAWASQEYRTISITGGTDATNQQLIAWFQANAVQQSAPTVTPSTSFGSLPLASASFGSTPVQSIWFGNVKVYERSVASYTITTTVANGSSSGAASIDEGGTATVTLSADSGYALPSTITVAGASYAYDQSLGTVVLSSPTGNVTISATCLQRLAAPTIEIGE